MSVLLSKLVYKGDVRNYGSHNAGATNMARVYGLIGGIATLAGDFLKAIVAMLIPLLFKLIYKDFAYAELAYAIAGMGCFLGHAFPIFFGFKGGKGVTVGAAIALMTDWKAFLIILAVFVIAFMISKIVSVSSISAAVALVVTGVLSRRSACRPIPYFSARRRIRGIRRDLPYLSDLPLFFCTERT